MHRAAGSETRRKYLVLADLKKIEFKIDTSGNKQHESRSLTKRFGNQFKKNQKMILHRLPNRTMYKNPVSPRYSKLAYPPSHVGSPRPGFVLTNSKIVSKFQKKTSNASKSLQKTSLNITKIFNTNAVVGSMVPASSCGRLVLSFWENVYAVIRPTG